MLPIFDGLRDVTMLSTIIRMLLAVVCGGLIGLEREYKRRPAGFRTHILICLGAAMTTLTSQFLYLNLHYYTGHGRLGPRWWRASASSAPAPSLSPGGAG